MNAQLLQMIAATDRNKRVKLAMEVQSQIDAVAKDQLRLIERQRVIVEALIAAGIETLPAGDDVLIVADMLKGGGQ